MRDRIQYLRQRLIDQRWIIDRATNKAFSNPRRLVCRVKQCPDCHRFARYYDGSQKRWGEVDYKFPCRKINGYWWGDHRDICDECEKNIKKFIEIDRCDECGKFRRKSIIGVDTRYDCYDYRQYESKAPKLCVSCWNKERRIWKCAEEAEEVKRLLNQFKRTISHEAR